MVDVTANGQFESGHLHLRWDESPVPAHEELIVGRKDAAVEHVKWRLEQWRPAALQNHPALLREGGRDAALIRTAGKVQVDEDVSPGGLVGGRAANMLAACRKRRRLRLLAA